MGETPNKSSPTDPVRRENPDRTGSRDGRRLLQLPEPDRGVDVVAKQSAARLFATREHQFGAFPQQNPVVIVEVLSRSTAARDRGVKRERYQAIPSLRSYVLVAQDKVEVDLYTKAGEEWSRATFCSLDDLIDIPPICAGSRSFIRAFGEVFKKDALHSICMVGGGVGVMRNDTIISMSAKPELARERLWTLEEYVALEIKAETKSEFEDGRILAMAGALAPHNKIGFNMAGALWGRLKGTPCGGYTSDMAIAILSPDGRKAVYYPDLVFSCGEAKFLGDSERQLVNPVVIVEVLSRSTSVRDRGIKRERYQEIPSLRSYVLVAQDKVGVDLYTKVEGEWKHRSFHSPDDTIDIPPICAGVPISEFY